MYDVKNISTILSTLIEQIEFVQATYFPVDVRNDFAQGAHSQYKSVNLGSETTKSQESK